MKTRLLIIILVIVIIGLRIILPNHWLEFESGGIFVCDRLPEGHQVCNVIWLYL